MLYLAATANTFSALVSPPWARFLLASLSLALVVIAFRRELRTRAI
jgi:hypothetical protein